MNLSIIKWTPELVMEWLNIAAKVDKSLPPVKMPKVTGQKWDVLREWYELLWEDDVSDVKPKWQPTNEQISMWEEVVLRWFKLIDSNTDKKIVWMHAAGMSWVKIGKKVHLSRQSVAAHHEKTINKLVEQLVSLYTEIS
jgi:hypothetical protein